VYGGDVIIAISRLYKLSVSISSVYQAPAVVASQVLIERNVSQFLQR
jgi:hypothetical protein